MLTSQHRFFFTAGWMHQVRANIREIPGAEHRRRNLRRAEVLEMLRYPLRVSSCLSYQHAEKQPTPQHSLPVGRRKQRDKNSCWNFPPVHPEGKRREPRSCLGSEEDPSCCISTVPRGRRHPWAGDFALFPAAPPVSSAKNEIFYQPPKSPARGSILILEICTRTLRSYLIRESARQPWGPAPSGGTEFVSFDNMDLMNRLPGTGNHFPRIAAK